mgnify:CR=1 FL=1
MFFSDKYAAPRECRLVEWESRARGFRHTVYDATRRALELLVAAPETRPALQLLRDGVVDYVNCDQVIMHTEDPAATLAELTRVCRPNGGQVACYFYAKKALPRELLDDHFRIACTDVPHEALWEMSAQLTELGRRLSALEVTFEAPDIPLLGIKGGTYDLQRFIYWNFIKCFWNEALGRDTSVATNFDWYSPSKARRFSAQEVHALVAHHGLTEAFFHAEEACYSGRFARP